MGMPTNETPRSKKIQAKNLDAQSRLQRDGSCKFTEIIDLIWGVVVMGLMAYEPKLFQYEAG